MYVGGWGGGGGGTEVSGQAGVTHSLNMPQLPDIIPDNCVCGGGGGVSL